MDWSQCDVCNGTDTGHLCSEHKAALDATCVSLGKYIAENWDEGFRNLVEGEPLTEVQKMAHRLIPEIPFGDSMLCVASPE